MKLISIISFRKRFISPVRSFVRLFFDTFVSFIAMGSETTDFYSSRYYYTSEIVFLLCRLPFIVISWYTRSILTSRLYRVLLIRNSKIRTKKLKIFQSIILIACNKVFVLQFLVNYIRRLSIYSLMLENFIWNKYIWFLNPNRVKERNVILLLDRWRRNTIVLDMPSTPKL